MDSRDIEEIYRDLKRLISVVCRNIIIGFEGKIKQTNLLYDKELESQFKDLMLCGEQIQSEKLKILKKNFELKLASLYSFQKTIDNYFLDCCQNFEYLDDFDLSIENSEEQLYDDIKHNTLSDIDNNLDSFQQNNQGDNWLTSQIHQPPEVINVLTINMNQFIQILQNMDYQNPQKQELQNSGVKLQDSHSSFLVNNYQISGIEKKIETQENNSEKYSPQKYVCTICSKEFKLAKGYRDHLKQIHRLVLLYNCPSCLYSSGWALNLTDHIVESHQIVKTMNSSSGRSKLHHIFKCPYTKRLITKKRSLEAHIRNIQEYYDPKSQIDSIF